MEFNEASCTKMTKPGGNPGGTFDSLRALQEYNLDLHQQQAKQLQRHKQNCGQLARWMIGVGMVTGTGVGWLVSGWIFPRVQYTRGTRQIGRGLITGGWFSIFVIFMETLLHKIRFLMYSQLSLRSGGIVDWVLCQSMVL